MKVTWFRHSHEDRNDLLRFGLMRLHYKEQVKYKELPLGDAKRFGFSKAILEYPDHRHLSFLLVENGRRKIRCLVDNEDSFALITSLISEVDICFCAGYNSDFFEKRRFVAAYSWQKEEEVAWYREMIEQKISLLGRHFSKIKKFVPITTNMGSTVSVPAWNQKIKNINHRFNRAIGKGDNFRDIYKGFEVRDAQLEALRGHSLDYDIVLRDSLWGWPQHRINLHHQLQNLQAKGYNIHSTLNWMPPVTNDQSSELKLDKSQFPINTLPVNGPYEQMLAKSRLAVLACGFHWGWRSVMMLALGIGIPVLTDRLLTEAYFDMAEFKIFQQEDDNWSGIESMLSSINEQQWLSWKAHNQKVYDKYMQPQAVANYFINSLD